MDADIGILAAKMLGDTAQGRGGADALYEGSDPAFGLAPDFVAHLPVGRKLVRIVELIGPEPAGARANLACCFDHVAGQCRVQSAAFARTNVNSATVDPKAFDAESLVDRETDVCIIPPNSFALARTVEYFRVPEDVLVICLGKSTYARCGIIVNVTPLEPGWEGHVTLEFSNTTPLPAKIYANEGACQFLFLQGNERCETSYKDRAGKYMGQRGVTLPRL